MDILYIKNEDGTWTSIPALKGAPGNDGVTPVRGVDYWTENDKKEIVQDVLTQLPSAEGGSF